MHWYLEVLRKYAVFSGRARRREYWLFLLFHVIIALALALIEDVIGLAGEGFGVLSGLYGLAVLVPGLAVLVRRLHDTGHSGWWLLITFVPLIGAIVLLVFLVRDGDPGDNRFGPNPKAAAASAGPVATAG